MSMPWIPTRSAAMIDKWVVLLNYNLASRCTRHAVAFYQRRDVGVFLVDNASAPADFAEIKRTALDMGGWLTDGGVTGANAAAIEQFVRSGGRIIVCRNPKNLGYAGGNN